MSDSFPPITTHERKVEALLNILASVVVERSAVYVSAPITSGKRLAKWLGSRNVEFDPSHPESYAEFQREVLEPNCEHAQDIITNLRKQFPNVVIDPTALRDIDGWTQDDYRYLWARVLEQYATTVVFIDGWQYSNGCSYEFLVSYQSSSDHCPLVLNENLKPLTLDQGLTLIRAAISEMKEAGLSTEFLERVAEQLASTALEEICARP
ncbi:MAG TPA: hypothetical protein DHU55_01110 [Blastocatellia bacterium]|nr:hypothetical protein [Blastocatellia bacterium]HAF23992.1 hypothetical protein [Blastocatellia bacterium]HCX28362.1 hypothetical protein [Blastocatellia bacterium]